MSNVTSIMLCFSPYEEYDIDGTIIIANRINSWVKETMADNRVLVQASDKAGGDRVFQHFVYMGAFNYFPTDRFIEFLRQLEWISPEFVQIFVKEEDDEDFTMMRLQDDFEG